MAILGNGAVVGFTANLDYFEKYNQLFGNIESIATAVVEGNANVYRVSPTNATTVSTVMSDPSSVVAYQTIGNSQPMTANIQSIDSSVLKITQQQVSKEQIINTFSSKPNFKF